MPWLQDLEREAPDQSLLSLEEEDNTGWQTVTQLNTQPVDMKTEVKAVLQEEPTINEGLACALNLARQKGVLVAFINLLHLLYGRSLTSYTCYMADH